MSAATIGSHLVIILEMIFMNLLALHQCSKKKCKTSVIFLTYLAVTAAVVGIAMPFLMRGQGYGNGNGLLVLIGFVYLVPIHFMYEQKTDRTLIVLCSAFVYSMLAFSLAVHIGKLFGEAYFTYITMAMQTLIYLVSAPAFLKFITGKFSFVLDNIPHQINHYLRWLSLVCVADYGKFCLCNGKRACEGAFAAFDGRQRHAELLFNFSHCKRLKKH